MKVKTTTSGNKIFKCPGCETGFHSLRVRIPGQQVNHPSWKFNFNHDRPTFEPSILARRGGSREEICHSFVTDGKIQFLSDCTHALKGQTVEIPDWPYSPDEFGGIVD